jgi:hypothetical protein
MKVYYERIQKLTRGLQVLTIDNFLTIGQACNHTSKL